MHETIARPAKRETNAKVTSDISPLLAKISKETVKIQQNSKPDVYTQSVKIAKSRRLSKALVKRIGK